ncbi:CotS family spore coat protein [Pontibacillus salicampi]|uniref:CotS family spore coat protein n=1 Tax=Pontibacillus salicampi TaxID=1449801 RepID=A0ABV6LQE2_9BACI
MENHIVPWEVDELVDDFFVPDYIVAIGKEVLTQYDFTVSSMDIVTTKPDKGGAIWKIETNRGPLSFKLLHRRPTRSLFSLGAQEYLVDEKAARVPPIVKTKDGKNFVEAGDKLWFVAEWIEPLEPVTKDLEGAKQLCYALGEFHRLTKGYQPPNQAEIASRIHKWPRNYEKVVLKLDWFRNIARQYPEMPASQSVLEVVDQFQQQAKESYERLTTSQYAQLASEGNAYWGLVHQDYGWSNAQMGENGMWIIDLDGVAFDITIRDLRKLITGTMADLFAWDATWVRDMIQAYHAANPISEELYEVLMIDLSVPNEFYKNVKEMVYDPELFLDEQASELIRTIVALDETKWPVLEEIKDDWKGMNPS